MPRVYLTAEQREQAAIDKIRLALSDGIAVQKSRNRLTNKDVAHGLELGERTIANIINQEDVKLPISQVIRLLKFAGLSIVKKEDTP